MERHQLLEQENIFISLWENYVYTTLQSLVFYSIFHVKPLILVVQLFLRTTETSKYVGDGQYLRKRKCFYSKLMNCQP